ncbi:MAG TPA: cell surface protein SprA [Balneolaceae bacterium]
MTLLTGRSMAQVRADSVSPVMNDSLPRLMQLPPVSLPFAGPIPDLFYINLLEEQTYIQRNSSGMYHSQRLLFSMPVALPYVMNLDEYARRNMQHAVQENWQMLIRERQSVKQEDGLLDFKLDIPGGEESTFTSIFGKPEVNLRINGTANMSVGASIQKVENPSIPEDQQKQIDPTFGQNLKLNIQGTIGDKLSIQTDWDTERAFDFMNRVSIVYDGYDNEILQRVEMGNVSMQTGNSLIRGGSALFGIKSIAQVGALKLTSVFSQQEGESNVQTITGGAQESEFAIRPADYEADRHFFLGFYLRQQFEENVSNPQQLGQALQLIEINVWVLREATQSFEGERQAIALADLGVIQNADGTYATPNEALDAFDDATLDRFRDPALGVSAGDFGVDPEGFVEGYFIPLQAGVDYTLNRYLGYISLNRNLGSRQALAVSFKYRDPQTGQIISVGDVSQGGGNRIYLKLIRPQSVTTTNDLWVLMMKNIYSVGATNLSPEGLELDVKFTEQNIPSSSLPGRDSILLQDLGLDRVDQQGALNPDNKIDFSTSVLNAATGRIMFPYLQPFGDRIQQLLEEANLNQNQINAIVFNELYTEKKVNANQNSKNNFYLIEGSAKGSISASYSLGFSLVEGSVKVFANGRQLQEGIDYAVDYSIGSITILNEQYLRKGQQIKIEYENNQLAQIGRTSFTGLRAEYFVSDNIRLGSTYFKLKEKPLQDKIRIGDEPVNNAVFGFDANAYFDAPWLTRLIDQVPLLETKASSSISFRGEFAQLRPGVSRTGAVSDAIENNRLFKDETQGLSFVDDFEGTDISLSFMNPSRWYLAAAPAAVPGYVPDQIYFEENAPSNPSTTIADKIARSDLRSAFSWYSIPRNIDEILNGVQRTPETRPVQVTDVFPSRDVLTEENFITTLDIHYDPTERGPYNYNDNLRNLLINEPERTWGGMTTTLPSGQEDLTQNNIQFLEFWVQSILPGGRTPTAQDLADYEGKIYIDIGVVSEDVVPNFKTNTEDGLARRPDDLQMDNIDNSMARSYIPIPLPAPEGQFSNDTRALEDVGLDGAPNTGGFDNKNEQNLFSEFIDEMRIQYGANSSMFSDIVTDPSNDDYVYYGEQEVANLALQERFYRMYGYHDGNSPANTGDKQAVTNKPDTEGLITPSIVQQNNAYFQYEIEWNPADLESLEIGSPGTYIVDKVEGFGQQDRWYQVRIPLEDWAHRIGNIQNFQNISYIRIWMSGYEKPFTLRFATLELVGSQWRNAENVDEQQGALQGEMNISTINIEENSQREPIPYRQPEGAIRAKNRSRQRQTIANEQSIVMNIQNLGPGELKMMKKVYPGGLNMVNYSNVRMYVHGEGYESREDAELVVRFGTDLTNNYYEYRQPITPSDPNYPFTDEALSELTEAERRVEAEQVWLYDENNMNVLLSAFNELKQLRDQQGNNSEIVYERGDILDEAPSGAVIAIKGNPSLDRIVEIGIGIRNPFDAQSPASGGVASLDGQFWFNELRVSGFDNNSGWAANASAEIKLADFALLSANFNRETNGFGALNSRLGQRRISDVMAYDLNSTINLHKLIPDRYGWNIPVNISTRRSSSTPVYLPNQGDVRLTEFEKAVEARDGISEQQKEDLISQKVRESQTVIESYSINLSNVTKTGSESALAEYTLDKMTLNYVYNNTHRRNPQYALNDNWNYSGSLRYDVSFRNTLLFRPFNFLRNVPLLYPLAGLRLGYTPSSLSASAGINREYDEQLRRFVVVGNENSLRQSHSFTYNTQFGFGYTLTPSINTTFQSRSVFDLSNAGIDRNATGRKEFTVRPTFDVFKGVLFDTLSSRRANYEEAYTASWQPRLSLIEAISWIDYSANYGGGYQWRNSPLNSGLGAIVSNNFTLSQSLDFNIQELLNRMEWYRNLQDEDDQREKRGIEDAGYSEDQLTGDLAYIGRKSLEALLSLQSIDASFNISKSALQTGYAGESQIFYMFNSGGNNFSPPFSYRTGITDEIGLDQLIDNPDENSSLQLPSFNNQTSDLTLGARFAPFDNLTIDLVWNTNWNVINTKSITIAPNENISSIRALSGDISSSVWAFGNGYGAFFRKQLATAFADINRGSTVITDSTGNRDGLSVLGKQSLEEDFRQAYLGLGAGAIGKRDFTPFPMPGWRIRWTGLENVIPYFGQFMARASITHNYSGIYRLGWVYNSATDLLPGISLGAYSIINRRPAYEPNTINIEKKFSPLVGLNITWESNLRTNLQYEYAKVTSLALTNSRVIERLSRGLKFSLGYTLRNFKIPFFPRIENTIDLTFSGSYIEDEEQKFVLDSDLGNALEVGPENIIKDPARYDFTSSFTGGQSRINLSATVGYQFSQTIRANFQYSYNRLIPKSSGFYARTDHDLLFNVVVSIRSD